jgi:hypothetical protein
MDGERSVVTLRFSPETRRQLEAAADNNGWSLAQEAVNRVDRSFWEDGVLGGSETAEVLRVLSQMIALVERRTGKRWVDDQMGRLVVETALLSVMRALSVRPDDPLLDDIIHADISPEQLKGADPKLVEKLQSLQKAKTAARKMASAFAELYMPETSE